MKIAAYTVPVFDGLAAEFNAFEAFLQHWYAERGWALVPVRVGHPTPTADILRALGPDRLITWGEQRYGYDGPTVCCEQGWWPQRGTIHLSPEGLWDRFEARFPGVEAVTPPPRVNARPPRPTGPVLVIGQVRGDRALRGAHTDTGPPLADHVRRLTPPDVPVVFRPHPRGPEAWANGPTRAGDLDAALTHARAVVGVSSTVLLEAAARDIPTYATGLGPARGGAMALPHDPDAAATELRTHAAWRRNRAFTRAWCWWLYDQCQIDLVRVRGARPLRISARNAALLTEEA